MAERLNRSILPESEALQARQDAARFWVDMMRLYRESLDTMLETADGAPPPKEFTEGARIATDQIRRDTCVDGSEQDEEPGQWDAPKKSAPEKPRYKVVDG